MQEKQLTQLKILCDSNKSSRRKNVYLLTTKVFIVACLASATSSVQSFGPTADFIQLRTITFTEIGHRTRPARECSPCDFFFANVSSDPSDPRPQSLKRGRFRVTRHTHTQTYAPEYDNSSFASDLHLVPVFESYRVSCTRNARIFVTTVASHARLSCNQEMNSWIYIYIFFFL